MLRIGLGRFTFLILLLPRLEAAADDVRFTSPPQAARKNGTVNIRFAVNRDTDVAVFIENARGKVVRHLAAGMLGKNPPERPSLDSGGPHARVKKPDIPLAWPVYVAVSDRHAYVADTVNRRVVRVKLGASAEGTCAIP